MATRQEQEPESDSRTTSESTEQTDLFTATESASQESQSEDTSRCEETTSQVTVDGEMVEADPESWAAPFTAHKQASPSALAEPQAISEAREFVNRFGNEQTTRKLEAALCAATVGECISNVQCLMGIHSELQGTHMYDENLCETAQKVMSRLQAGR